jgi:hypothetical protein
MRLVAHTHALIIALRRNGGGWPNGAILARSYLFPEADTHLADAFDARFQDVSPTSGYHCAREPTTDGGLARRRDTRDPAGMLDERRDNLPDRRGVLPTAVAPLATTSFIFNAAVGKGCARRRMSRT